MAGTTMIDYLTFKMFWKFADLGDVRSLGLIPLMAKYGSFIRAGGIVIILSGISIVSLKKEVWLSQPWFKIKLLLFFLLLLNGMFVGNVQGHKLREKVSIYISDFIQHTGSIREYLNFFYPAQLTLFFFLILISVIRFDKIGDQSQL
jgi:hypothetical protein